MEMLTKDSLIVEVCSNLINKKKVENEDYQKAQEVIKELSTKRDPQSLFELSQLVGFLVDDKLNQNLAPYIDAIADVKRVGLGDKAEFKMQKGVVTALWQAKGSTAQRSMVGTSYKTIETDEVSAAPAVELEQMQNGQIDFTSVVNQAAEAMEAKIAKQIETVIEAAWDDLGSPRYGSGSGVVANTIDPLITAIGRLGSPVILGDSAALQKFTALTAFNSNVANDIAVEFHKTGLFGYYKGAKLVQLVNPLANDTDFTTVLDPGYIYIVPAGFDASKRPLKVALEGEVQTYNETHVKSRVLEIPMYKKVGIGLASVRNGMALYEDTAL